MNIAVDRVERLTDGQRSVVLGLVRTASHRDEVAPLSEQVLLAVGDSQPTGTSTATGSSSSHFLAYAGPHLVGYAHLDRGDRGPDGGSATAELMVEPSRRRQGVGTALIRALEGALVDALVDALADRRAGQSETLHVWSHGDLPGARAIAHRRGYSAVRELWQMRRSLRPYPASLPEGPLPHGFSARQFVVGRDEAAWLRVNARAFVDHPEQGRMTRRDLDQRIAEPWFDATGFILVEDTRGPVPVLAASHWTKVVAAGGAEADEAFHPAVHPVGEVYVVGVDPAYQGLGLGRAVTVLGLAHLRDQGLSEAMLYVDADNRAAVATYSRLDFARYSVDIMYSRTVHPPV